MSVNDILRLQDLEPIGTEGDVYLTPMNMDDAGSNDVTEPDGAENEAKVARLVRG